MPHENPIQATWACSVSIVTFYMWFKIVKRSNFFVVVFLFFLKNVTSVFRKNATYCHTVSVCRS